jgi:hypothetical protein
MVGRSSVSGHVEYSRLLQDCFFDLNDVFVYHKGGDLSLSSTKGDTSMKTTMCWFILVLASGLVWQPGVAGTVISTVGRQCYPTTFSTTSGTATISVYGDWIENIDRATSPSGVTVNIIGKFNGLQNNSGPFAGKGKVTLRINTNDASLGNKTISLINDPDFGVGGETFTFNITVLSLRTVTSLDVPTPADPFQEITVTLNGTGLQQAKDPAAGLIVIDNLIPFITTGGNASVSSVRVLSSSSTSLQAKIFFSALIQDATVELTLSNDNECVPLGALPPLKKRVRVRSSNIKNYVKSITFPAGNTFDKGSIGTININLLFVGPTANHIEGLPSNSKVFLKFGSGNVTFAKPDGTPFPTNTGGFIPVNAAGVDIVPIKFKVIDCSDLVLNLNVQTVTLVGKIKTWMHSTSTNLPPNFLEQTFSVRCQ